MVRPGQRGGLIRSEEKERKKTQRDLRVCKTNQEGPGGDVRSTEELMIKDRGERWRMCISNTVVRVSLVMEQRASSLAGFCFFYQLAIVAIHHIHKLYYYKRVVHYLLRLHGSR